LISRCAQGWLVHGEGRGAGSALHMQAFREIIAPICWRAKELAVLLPHVHMLEGADGLTAHLLAIRLC
jgi:hypothetical protein